MAKVNLTKKINGDRYCPVVLADNGRIKPDYVLVNGAPEKHTEGAYYIDWTTNGKRHRKMVGKSASNALAQQLRKHAELTAIERGLVVEGDGTKERLGLEPAVTSFLEEIGLSRKHKTYQGYQIALQYFQESCKRAYVDEIDRRDMLKFTAYLRDECELSPRTVSNKFEAVMTFLKTLGRSKELRVTKHDRPKFVQQEPEVYTREELQFFFSKCSEDERVLWQFFLMTGMREKEIVFCMWRNVLWNASIIQMRWKPEFKWTPKAYKEREIPVPKTLLGRLESFKKERNSLIFPTESGKPKFDFLHILKARTKRFGLNPDEWWLHKFRATFATWHLQAGVDLRTVQAWLGHTDLESTMRYLRPARSADVQDKVNATFG